MFSRFKVSRSLEIVKTAYKFVMDQSKDTILSSNWQLLWVEFALYQTTPPIFRKKVLLFWPTMLNTENLRILHKLFQLVVIERKLTFNENLESSGTKQKRFFRRGNDTTLFSDKTCLRRSLSVVIGDKKKVAVRTFHTYTHV